MSTPAGKTYLFVNKHQGSTALSNNRTGAQPYSQINSHVQKGSKRSIAYRKKPEITSTRHLIGWNQTSGEQKERQAVKEEQEGKSDLLVLKDEQDEPDFNTDPSRVIDSYCQSTFKVDQLKQSIIHYYNTVWMPSVDHIPYGCQLTAFTPIWPNDGKLAFDVVQGAFQSNDEVSMYALLTAATRRMKMVHKVEFRNPELPDFYAVKAIQALRSFIAESKRPNHRLILDLSYLVLAELYRKSPSRSEVYWRMKRNLIVSCGGLHKIPPFTAQVALAYDFFMSLTTLTVPALDPFTHPALVGMGALQSGDTADEEIFAKVVEQLEPLDPRIRILAQESIRLTQTIKAFRALPEVAVDGVLNYIRDPGTLDAYALIGAAFVPSGANPEKTMGLQRRVARADALAIHVRFQAFMLWVWFSAVGILRDTAQPSIQSRGPGPVLGEISTMWRFIDRIHILLHDSGWMMQDHVVLWICTLGVLVADSASADRTQYTRLLVKMATRLKISSEQELQSALAHLLPFDSIHSQPVRHLWNILVADMISNPPKKHSAPVQLQA